MSTGHIRPRGPGAWELKYDLGADPISGKRRIRYRTVHGNRRDAQRELRELLGAVDQGRYADPGKMTVGGWLEQWLAEAKHGVSPKTHERYTEIVNKHLVPALGALPLAKLAPVHIQSYYSDALKSGRLDGKGGLSAQTVRHHDRALNTALKRARRLRLIAVNPAEDVARPKVEKRELSIPDQDEFSRLFTVAATTRMYVPAALTLATGMRRGELLALRWSDIDLDAGTLQVVRSLEQTRVGVRFKAPKTRRSRRTIVLPATAVAMLREHRVRQGEERLALGLGRNELDLVFTQVGGGVINPGSFSMEFGRLVRRAGIRPITFHTLRHAHITELLRAGVHPKIASERAGHSSVGITLDTYSHVVPGMQEAAARQIDSALRTLFGGKSVAKRYPARGGGKLTT